MEAFVSYLMIGILTSLVNLSLVGLATARAGGQSMTSSPPVCAPYEFLCVHRLMSQLLNPPANVSSGRAPWRLWTAQKHRFVFDAAPDLCKS